MAAAALACALAGCGGEQAANGAVRGPGDTTANAGAGTQVPAGPMQSTDGAAGAATSSANTADGAAASGAASRARIVLLGTSLTAGLGLNPATAYPALLQAKLDSAQLAVEIVNAGLSGETSAGALRRAGWVLDRPAAAVVLEVGANDGLRGTDPDSTAANIEGLIAEIRQSHPAAKILLVQMEAPTNLGRDYTTRFHAAYARVAKATGVPLLPFLLDGVAGNPRLNQADGIHPNVDGSRIVAATMWTALRPTFVAVDSAARAGSVAR